jgi:hypothetical protein
MLFAGPLALLLLLLAPTAATPEGGVVIEGAASGSHIAVSLAPDGLVVHGYMEPGATEGCHPTHGRMEALCSLEGAGLIEIDMGPNGDFVEVLDSMPLPIVAHLGGGSDKMIANGEQDTCYPEGARRNRCVGGPGRDICVTGQRNSDCVGGAGDDVCRHGDGSDGCWGGPGDDVCFMGAGEDGCHGEQGNDRLYGGPAPDQLYGGPGRDFCDGEAGVGKSHDCELGPGH